MQVVNQQQISLLHAMVVSMRLRKEELKEKLMGRNQSVR